MAKSLGLSAYSAWAKRAELVPFQPVSNRPEGEVVWIHAGEAGNYSPVFDLACRIAAARYDLSVLITVDDLASVDAFLMRDAQSHPYILVDQSPGEHPSDAAKFMTHWAPDTGIWVWGGLRPNLVLSAIENGLQLMLIDASDSGFDGRRDRWLPEVTRHVLSHFTTLMARSQKASQRLVKLGVPHERIEITAPLLAGGQALPCDETTVNDLSAALTGRSVWLATGVQTAEIPMVLAAHRRATRLSHRLLLILHPAAGVDAATCLDQAKDAGFRSIDWADGGFPDESTQVMVADDPMELGVFYRVAPVAFLGSSMLSDSGGCNPFEAAALGSAVLYGPKVSRFEAFYTRLSNAGAARAVVDDASLGTAVTRLIAPDQAAAMAHAGWDVISQGAELTDRIVDLVQETLDQREGNP
ncbi:MAG: glycosyltransferase N-terminal domain-containing protein [Sulfitobacter sp.]